MSTKLDEILPSEYGYVILVAVSSMFLLSWMALRVMAARKKFSVQYPTMYSDKDPMFNCVQRVHQNTLEGYSIFLMLLLFAGLFCPKSSAICGVIWIIGKVAYAFGYYTGDPAKRRQGAIAYLGLLPLLGMTIVHAIMLILKD